MKKLKNILVLLLLGLCLVGCEFGGGPKTYTVTFKDGTEVLETQKVKANDYAVEPDEPLKEGYVFVGWYLDGEEFDFAEEITKNITLTAKWEEDIPGYKIRFVTNGGEELSPLVGLEEGEIVALPTPKKTGYDFLGWYDSEELHPNNRVTMSYRVYDDVVLYANWQAVRVTITFVTNCEVSVPTLETRYLEEITLPTPEREDYDFLGWYLDENKYEETVAGLTDITLTAKWEIRHYTLTFDPDGGTISSLDKNVIENIEASTCVTLPLCTKLNNIFLGWYYTENGVEYRFTNDTPVKKNLTLTAKWDDLSKYDSEYEITYHLDGGDFYKYSSHLEVVKLFLEDVSKYLNKNVTTETFYMEMQDKLSGADGFFNYQKMYEKWSFILSYLQTKVDSNYASLFDEVLINQKLANESVVANEILAFLKKAEITQPSAPYVKSANYANIDVCEGYFDNIKVEAINKYKVGEGLALQIPYKKGYIFDGFYDNANFYGSKYTTIDIVEHSEKVFYAKWIEMKEEYSVTFVMPDGKQEIKTVKYGNLVTEIALDSYGGYELSWYLGREIFDFNTLICEDITLTANWTFLEENIKTLLPDETFDNITLPNIINTNNGIIKISWKTSDENTLSKTGVTNPARCDTKVILTLTMNLNDFVINHEIPIIVKAISFESLTGKQATFGYFFSNMSNYKGLTETAASALDVINYSFARCTEDGVVSISGLTKIPEVLQARKQGVRVVLCIGGYGAVNKTFSDAALTKEGREKFAQAVLDIIEKYHFDGVDIDWEYPGYETGRDTSVDRPNYTNLMYTIRKTLKSVNEDYLVTAAVPGGPWGNSRFDINNLNSILDYFHLMTYDFHNSSKVVHHTALYSSSGTSTGCSVDSTVALFKSLGASPSKLVVGAAFYGRKYVLSEDVENKYMLGSTKVAASGECVTFTQVYNNYIKKVDNVNIFNAFDSTSKAHYIIDKPNRVVISYESTTSLSYKCQYVKANNLGGLMFWDYGEDATGLLINTINNNMK